MRKLEKRSQETTVQPWGRSWFLLQGYTQQYLWALYRTKIRNEWKVFSSVQLLSCVQLFVTPRTVACQASLFITNSRSLLKLMSMESVMPSNHLTFCRPLLLPPSIFPSIRVFCNESVLHIRWPKLGYSFFRIFGGIFLSLYSCCLISLIHAASIHWVPIKCQGIQQKMSKIPAWKERLL